MPNFSLSGAFAWTDAKLTQDVDNLFAPGVGAFDGDRLPGTPEYQAYVAAHYEIPLSDGSDLAFDWSMSYQSDVLTKVGERDFGQSLSSFYLNNVSVTWLNDAWRVSLYADNVLDELRSHRCSCGYSSSYVTTGLFTLRRYYENMVRPRQVGLKFIYNFED